MVSVFDLADAAPLTARNSAAASAHDDLMKSSFTGKAMSPRFPVDYIGGVDRAEGVELSARPSLLDIHPAKAARVARARIPASYFRTETLAPDERFAAWRESVGVFL